MKPYVLLGKFKQVFVIHYYYDFLVSGRAVWRVIRNCKNKSARAFSTEIAEKRLEKEVDLSQSRILRLSKFSRSLQYVFP